MVKLSLDTPGTIATIIIAGIAGYFVYGRSIDAAIAVMIITFVLGLVTLLSLIPVFGWVAAVLLSYFVVIPGLLTMTGIEHTWLITVLFIANALLGLVITIFVSAVFSRIISRR